MQDPLDPATGNAAWAIGEIERGGIIAILRGDLRGETVNVVEALLRGGVTAIEITMNSPGALASIRTLRKDIDASFALGVGTVLSVEEVEAAFDSGAQFIVSPNVDTRVIEATKRLGMASFPGGATCTEILSAQSAGADAIKIFPASACTPKEMRIIRGPLDDVRLVPTGGIAPADIAEYCSAGAWAFGIGSALVDAKKQKTKELLEEDARRFIRAVAQGRGSQ
jgi:2-dehydro-3-deoxyphosphogluconate aldolase/(4S)-4-hydroxy-2-oxoglutarate aldolase